MHDPCEALAALKGWTLRWTHLPGDTLGYTCWARRQIVLRSGLHQRQERATLAHEVIHAVRGPVPEWMQAREERTVEHLAARQLIDLHDLGEALAWSHHLCDVAEDLWVDEGMVRARLEHLHPAERAYLVRRLSHDNHDGGEQ